MISAESPERQAADLLRATPWPAEDLEGVTECPACAGGARSLLYEDLWDATFLVAPGRWSLWRCGDCQSAFLDPRPTQSSVGRAYERYYTHDQEHGVDKPRSAAQYLKRALANGYRNGRYGGELRPSFRLGWALGTLVPSVRRSIDYGFRYLPRPEASPALLDVGCGAGAWLHRAAAAGWLACGVDLDPVAIEQARSKGLDVRLGSIDTWSDRAESFGAVTMSHVIEHVPNPMQVLQSAFELLRPGGTLYIDTPNVNAPTLAIYGRDWRGLEVPRHFVLFGKDALVRLLVRVGFKNIVRHDPPDVAAYLISASEQIRLFNGLKEERESAPIVVESEPEFITITCQR